MAGLSVQQMTYDKVNNLEDKLDEFIKEIRMANEETRGTADKAHQRIDKWENRAWGIGAIATAMGTAAGFILNKMF